MSQNRAAAQREEKVATLYDRLGGETTVNAGVQQLYRKVLADGRIAPFFETVDMERQIAMQKASYEGPKVNYQIPAPVNSDL